MLLPDPLCPMTPKDSPSATRKEMSRKAEALAQVAQAIHPSASYHLLVVDGGEANGAEAALRVVRRRADFRLEFSVSLLSATRLGAVNVSGHGVSLHGVSFWL